MPRKFTSSPDPEKTAYWRAIIDEQQASGLSQAEYCRLNNLSANTFSFWKSIIFPERRPIVQGNAQKRVDTKVFSPAEQIRLVKKWKKSGLTQAEFCRREKITEWQLSSWKLKAARQNKNLPKSDFVEIDLLSQKEAKTEQMDREIEKQSAKPDPVKAVAEIRFHSASLCILPGAAVADLKNILMALMECANDRTK